MSIRFTFGGDEHIFAEVSEEMSLEAFFTSLSMTNAVKAAGIKDSWAALRQTLAVQCRVTSSLRRRDGRTVHVRKSTVAEPALMKIYQALNINPAPGGTKKLIC